MAHKKGQGSSRNGRDSNGQRRGVKRYGGQQVVGHLGDVLQRGGVRHDHQELVATDARRGVRRHRLGQRPGDLLEHHITRTVAPSATSRYTRLEPMKP